MFLEKHLIYEYLMPFKDTREFVIVRTLFVMSQEFLIPYIHTYANTIISKYIKKLMCVKDVDKRASFVADMYKHNL